MKRGKIINFNAFVGLFKLVFSGTPALSVRYPNKFISAAKRDFLRYFDVRSCDLVQLRAARTIKIRLYQIRYAARGYNEIKNLLIAS